MIITCPIYLSLSLSGQVKLDGKVGLVPDNFVELLPSQPAESLEPPPPVKKGEPLT